MRGDSLRDLYAKTLALVGLGVLAGVGALFDYWPAGIRLVPAAPALELPELAASFTVPELSRPGVRHEPARPVTRQAEPRPPAATERQLPVVALTEPVALVDALPAVQGSLAAELPAPVMTLAEHLPAGDVPGAVGIELLAGDESVHALPISDVAVESSVGWRQPVSLVDSSADVEDGGFLSGALRKTRTSLVRTGARTGASIVDAVRVVGGAVRRALPN